MKRKLTVAVVCLLVGGVGIVGAEQHAESGGGSSEVVLSLGEQVSVSVSAQGTEVRSAVEDEAFEIALGENRTRAVNERVSELGERVGSLREDKREVERERENGNISEGRYRVKLARLEVKSGAVNESAGRVLDKVNETGLDSAAENGVNVESIRRLKQNASELAGPEVAEIARNIAGNAPERAGPPEGVGPASGNGEGEETEDRGAGPPEGVGPQNDEKVTDRPETEDDDADGDSNVSEEGGDGEAEGDEEATRRGGERGGRSRERF